MSRILNIMENRLEYMRGFVDSLRSDSGGSSFEEKENRDVKEYVSKLKQPYLKKIEAAKIHFGHQIALFQQTQREKSLMSEATVNLPQVDNVNSQSDFQEPTNNHPRILTQSSNDQVQAEQMQPHYREWNLETNQKSLFKKTDDMVDHFNQVFKKKIQFSNNHNSIKGDSFKVEQKQVISKIFKEIVSEDGKSVTFSSICQFFEGCKLFYHLYNIHPHSLKDVISDAAHHYADRLTEDEFMNLFLLNNRTNMDYENYNIQRVSKQCVFGQQNWAELKQIFIVFDTFGNETIKLRQFLQKLKVNIVHKHLLDQPVLLFPSINRHYTLRKILFEVEYKLNISDDYVKWQDIKRLIGDFKHIQIPTIDVIEHSSIAAGKISLNSNTYMLKDNILTFLKEVYDKSPKYCDHFIKVSNYASDIYQLEESKQFMPEIVRNKYQTVTFQQALSQLRGHPLQYLDLDEIIQWFSIKGGNNDEEIQRQIQLCEQVDSDSDDEFNKKRKQLEKNRKQIQNLPKKYSSKQESDKQLTKIQQFNLYKREKPSIREKKVKEMLQQKEEKERKQSSKKFKANPIPASINNEKYLEYKEKTQKDKEMILAKLNEVKDKDVKLMKYLEANTKLFEKHVVPEPQPIDQYVFQAKTIPWFVQVNLLDKIRQDKQENQRIMRKMNKMKYLKEWKNLPSFLQEMNIMTEITIKKGTNETISPIKKTIKPKEVPNFEELHKKFKEELEQKKKTAKKTVVQQFNLTSPRQQKSLKQSYFLSTASQVKDQPKNIPDDFNYIGSTLKYQSWLKHSQRQRLEEEYAKEQVRREEKERQNNKKMFAKYMRKTLAKQLKHKGKSLKKNERKHSQNTQSQQEMADMYKRVFSRPFLFQSNSLKNTKTSKMVQSRAKPVNMKEESEINELIEELHLPEEHEQQEMWLQESERSRRSC